MDGVGKMNDQPKIKMLVSAPVLRQIFADNPEVELELVKNATAQVAEYLKGRIRKANGIAEQIVREINESLSNKYRMTPEVLAEIRKVAAEAADRALTEKITRIVQTQIETITKAHTKSIEAKLDQAITKIAEDRVSALLVTMSRMGR